MNLEFTFLTILIIIFIGYLTKKVGLLTTEDTNTINKIVLNIALPSLVFYSIYNSNMSLLPKLGMLPIAGLISSFLLGGLTYAFLSLKQYDKKTIWTVLTVIMMSSTAFIGFPVILGIFGNDGLIRAIFCDINTNIMLILLNIILLFIFGGDIKKVIKKVITLPLLWALILGFTFNLLNIQIGEVVLSSLSYLKAATIPLILISLGLSIDFSGLTRDLKMVSLVSIIKLVINPIIAIGIFYLLGINRFEFTIGIIQSAMPCAMFTLAFAIDYDLDVKLSSDCIIISMIISLITLPILISII